MLDPRRVGLVFWEGWSVSLFLDRFENWFSGRVSLVLYFSPGVGLGSGADTGRGVAGYSGNGVEGE